MFDHCKDLKEAWSTLYTVACLCHPSQGGSSADMDALWDMFCTKYEVPKTKIPNVFDIYCIANGVQNPFGTSIEDLPVPESDVAPVPSHVLTDTFCRLSPVGRVSLVALGSCTR